MAAFIVGWVAFAVATIATHQSAKVPSLHLATYGWLIGKMVGGVTDIPYRTFVFSVRS